MAQNSRWVSVASAPAVGAVAAQTARISTFAQYPLAGRELYRRLYTCRRIALQQPAFHAPRQTRAQVPQHCVGGRPAGILLQDGDDLAPPELIAGRSCKACQWLRR